MARKKAATKTSAAKAKGDAPGAEAVVTLDPEQLPAESVYIGQSNKPEFILLRLANRHGLITGATGTGKTVTLQGLAEAFSDQGVPVFCADVKGDLSGVAEKGEPKGWIEQRAKLIGYEVDFKAYPVIFWDLFGEQGLPIRTTVSEMGPLLLSRLMDLSEAQEGVLNIAFKIAADEKLLLLNLKDLQALLENLAARADTLTTKYGNITKASVGSIQRSLLVLDQQGAEHFFGEPVLKVERSHAQVARWARLYQRACRRQADGEPAALCDLPAVPDVGVVRDVARGGRSGQTEARVLLRRGTSPVQGRAEGTAGEGRAGGAAHSIKGGRRLFRDAEPARCSRHRFASARQPGAARAARLLAFGAESGEGRGDDLPCQSLVRYREGHHGAWHRRGAGLDARPERPAQHRGAHVRQAAKRACGADHRCRAQGCDQGEQRRA